MRIIETEINDIQIDNLEQSKLNLSESIISYIQPIFSNDYNIKIREIKNLKKNIIEKQDLIQKEKNELSIMLSEYSKKDKEKQLLDKMSKLIQHGLIQESMKSEMATILKSFNDMSEEKIISYLNETITILSKKFAKN